MSAKPGSAPTRLPVPTNNPLSGEAPLPSACSGKGEHSPQQLSSEQNRDSFCRCSTGLRPLQRSASLFPRLPYPLSIGALLDSRKPSPSLLGGQAPSVWKQITLPTVWSLTTLPDSRSTGVLWLTNKAAQPSQHYNLYVNFCCFGPGGGFFATCCDRFPDLVPGNPAVIQHRGRPCRLVLRPGPAHWAARHFTVFQPCPGSTHPLGRFEAACPGSW